jgi:hypothetical protein
MEMELGLSRFGRIFWGIVTGNWKRLHNEELQNLHTSPNIIRVTASRRMR